MAATAPTEVDLLGLLICAAAGDTRHGTVALSSCLRCRAQVWAWGDSDHVAIVELHRWADGSPWLGLHHCPRELR